MALPVIYRLYSLFTTRKTKSKNIPGYLSSWWLWHTTKSYEFSGNRTQYPAIENHETRRTLVDVSKGQLNSNLKIQHKKFIEHWHFGSCLQTLLSNDAHHYRFTSIRSSCKFKHNGSIEGEKKSSENVGGRCGDVRKLLLSRACTQYITVCNVVLFKSKIISN